MDLSILNSVVRQTPIQIWMENLSHQQFSDKFMHPIRFPLESFVLVEHMGLQVVE